MAESDEKFAALEAKIRQQDEDGKKMKATIKELEKRRDQAIKEIRSLKHQINKEKKQAQAQGSEAAATSVADNPSSPEQWIYW